MRNLHKPGRGSAAAAALCAAACWCVALLGAAPARADSTACPWLNSALQPGVRATALLAAMSLDDKLALVHGVQVTDAAYADGGAGYAGYVPANPRLCIPGLTLNDAGAGIGDGQVGTTAFPAPIAQAATWDTALQQKFGRALGSEAWHKGVDVLLGPDVNIARVPQNGRNFEAFGEDPYLSGQVAAAEIGGIQQNPVIATVKHYAINSQETNRYWVSSIVDERTLHEIYLPPFEAAIRQAHVGGVMCAYGLVNAVFSCQDQGLLTTVLRGELGFGGFVVSDWGATMSSATAVNAGLDLQMPYGTFFDAPLRADLASGAVAAATLDTMVRRILTTMFRLGVFDRPPPPRDGVALADVSTPADQNVALRLAEEGTVLLKNSRAVLPLALEAGRQIAVIGAPAGAGGLAQFVSGGGSAFVAGLSPVSPLQAITERAARAGDTVVYADGSDPAAAAALAAQSAAAIVFGYDQEREGTDRMSLQLPDEQDQLIQAVAQANPRTVVVLDTGGPVLMPWLPQAAAVLEAWYPGQEDGSALAPILFGDVSPSGKLPQTFPGNAAALPTASPAQWPGVNDAQDALFLERMNVGYRWYDAHRVQPLFPFGFGLSYTRFAYRGLTVSRHGTHVALAFTVRNVGTRSGSEIAQVYVADPAAAGEPPRQLEGYRRVFLRAGQSGGVRIDLGPRAFSQWSTTASRWTIRQGSYGILVGSSSRDVRLRAAVTLGR